MFKIKENFETQKNVIIISKKVIKKAVERNLLKRRIRVILNEISKDKKKYFLFIVNSENLKNLSFNDLKNRILSEFSLKIKND